MGALVLPSYAPVYVDANLLIYTVERVQPYVQALDRFWLDASARHLDVVTSELSLLEVLVGPLKAGDSVLEADFRRVLLTSRQLALVSISRPILERAARLRAAVPGLKTPDAIHAATALEEQCGLLLTNDPGFRQIPNLNVTLLNQIGFP